MCKCVCMFVYVCVFVCSMCVDKWFGVYVCACVCVFGVYVCVCVCRGVYEVG